MYDYLIGVITHQDEHTLTLEAGGIGFRLYCPLSCLKSIENATGLIKLFTYHYLREDQEKLFGFMSREERNFFEWMSSISGIGPKTALGILSAGTLEKILLAAQQENPSFFQKISGIGKKMAEKIVVELKNQKKFTISGHLTKNSQQHSYYQDAFHALETLGFKEKEIEECLHEVLFNRLEPPSLQTVIRTSLQMLTRGKIAAP